mgnify:FL=1|tara:strand:- start:86 stop:400 length:315 start_codon:yes stop_codon:yes gene_type:complete
MAITADINLGNGVSATSTYIIIPCSQVMKYKTDVGDMVFKLVYDVQIYENKNGRDTAETGSKRLSCISLDKFKIDYDPTSTDNPFKLAYDHLKTNSLLSNVSDA